MLFRSTEYSATLGDIESMSHLGLYYAVKIRGACDLALFDKTGDEKQKASAVKHLEAALTHWKDYSTAYTKQYVQPVLYIHGHGKGQVLYLTLGHCRGKYDMQPYIEEYPVPEEGAWKTAEFYELLRRGIRWAMEPIQ